MRSWQDERALLPWDERWGGDAGWDEFTELVATMADDLIPLAVPLDRDWPHHICAEIVLWLIEDCDMRRNLIHLLRMTDIDYEFTSPESAPTEDDDSAGKRVPVERRYWAAHTATETSE